jgi:orotate phosphoribosyltransferase
MKGAHHGTRNSPMTEQEVLAEFRAAGALLAGHFILSSGLHSAVCFATDASSRPGAQRALRRPRAAKAPAVFGQIDVVISPAVGGIVPGYETAHQLRTTAISVEPQERRFVLRRGFEIAVGARIPIVEDIITTGLSGRECSAAISGHPGRLIGAACLIDRSGGAAEIGCPKMALATLDIPAFPADRLPPELAAIAAHKPGSRGLNPS